MPELPEVETTLRGVLPHLQGQRISHLTVRDPRLRQPVPEELAAIVGQKISGGWRRSKYLLLTTDGGQTLLIHLGMSGSLRICEPQTQPRKHDHVILTLGNGRQLHYHDPRRFGCVLWLTDEQPEATHPLLRDLGPEPLGDTFNAGSLFAASRGRSAPIKTFIMNARVVVGVGNIYACESLFMAGIHPHRAAGKVSRARYTALVQAVREVLQQSITQGGTTLRDFVREDGQPGYFKQSLRVYDRAGLPCLQCGTPIERTVLGQRATYFCPRCQPK